MLGEKVKDTGPNFRRSIMQVVRLYVPGTRIKKSSIEVMNTIVVDMMRSLHRECAELTEVGKQKTIQSNTVAAAVRMKFSSNMAQLADDCAMRAVNSYKAHTKEAQPQEHCDV